ncbi:uncharacterized protein LOC128954924 isoform X2 [Oppia nitens]|uniref:uncharacterized protein LOC128954924 isoform X2 n=1 Tax=Oppia nitens TaxID=1686743 RepID=UPI0023D9F579|nr:uncharacterized protein LOC128954924 isoform X2 [Oppia nitens]
MNNSQANRLSLSFATANFPEDYLPYTATYSRNNNNNKDPYLVWDSGFNVESSTSDGHHHYPNQHHHNNPHHTHTHTASIDSHSPASLNHYHMHSQSHLYPTCSGSSASWPTTSKKRKCCGVSCGCCWLTMLALVIISALATIVGFSIYLAMITNLHKSSQFLVNGSFKVDSGDNFNQKLINTSSLEFIKKANKYETIIKTALETSSLSNAITKQEVYAFGKGSLVVYFRLGLDRRKVNTVMESERRSGETRVVDRTDSRIGSDRKDSPLFDDMFAVKLIQKELRDGMSQLKITGTEQIIIDMTSIQVMTDLEPMTDRNVNDIKTSGFLSNKALSPIKAKDIMKQMSNKSSDIKPKDSQTDNSMTTTTTTTTTTTAIVNPTLPSLGKSQSTSQTDIDVRNASNITINISNTDPFITSALSTTTTTTTTPTTAHLSTTIAPIVANNESESNVPTTTKPNNYKSTTISYIRSTTTTTTVPPKSEYKNPFLPFTRKQSTTSSPKTPTTSIPNVRITTRSRLRSTTTTTTTTTTPPPPLPETRPPNHMPPTPPLPPLNDMSNVLMKRTDLKEDGQRISGHKEDGHRISGIDFGQWKPVVAQPPPPPPPKPIPPKPIPPPIQVPTNQQFQPNLGIPMKPKPQPPPHNILIPHRQRPPFRIPIPIGIPMREVPRLLDDDDDGPKVEDQTYAPKGETPKIVENHNISITHPTIGTTTTTSSTTPISLSSTSSPISPLSLSSAATRSPRLSSTTSDPSMVDGFIVPISVGTKPESSVQKTQTNKNDFFAQDFNKELRKNKSLNILNDNPIVRDDSQTNKDYYNSHSFITTTTINTTNSLSNTGSRVQELGAGSSTVFNNIPNVVNVTTVTSNNQWSESGVNQSTQSPTNSLTETQTAPDSPNSSSLLTKSPFDYFNVINETLFLSSENPRDNSDSIANNNNNNNITTNSYTNTLVDIITSTIHPQINSDINTANPPKNVRRVAISLSTTTQMPDSGSQLIAGLPLGVDLSKSDLMIPEKLIRTVDSSEPLYGERLPKYIPPALFNKLPNNDIISTDMITNTDEDLADETLYDDEIASINHTSPLDMIKMFSLTTTTLSHGLETTTAGSVCADNEFQCLSGECMPSRVYCNRRIECSDGSDERQCTCAHYLRAERQYKKLCDGVIDCHDMSDESDCPYCKGGDYVCPQSSVCIDKSKVCNGDNDCPNGDDESECISLVPNNQTLDETGKYFNNEGSLYIRQKGKWAPLCLDDININEDLDIKRNRPSEELWKIEDLGKAICRANSYSDMDSIKMTSLTNYKSNEFFKLEPFNNNNRISPSLSMWSSLFERSECLSKRTTYVKCKDFECGVRPVTNGIRRRIVGGQSSSQGSWPWQVALYREGEFQCGGVIVADQWLLTAAHCFHATRDAYWTARFGILRRGNLFASPYEQIRHITHVIVHKDYVDKGFINDIALLRLNEPINYSKHVRPVCMPTELDDESKWHRQLCTTVGWGKLFEHGRIFPDTLQEVKLPVISTEECRKRTLFLPLYKITDNMFCAGYDRGGRDACLGDSGGPLMCQKRNGKWFLLGVTSNGDGCGRAGRPGVYTKVAKYMDWIDSVINNDLEPETIRVCDGHRCPLGRCIKKDSICNGIMDCRDSSDEQNCTDFSRKKSDFFNNDYNKTDSSI